MVLSLTGIHLQVAYVSDAECLLDRERERVRVRGESEGLQSTASWLMRLLAAAEPGPPQKQTDRVAHSTLLPSFSINPNPVTVNQLYSPHTPLTTFLH